jgi:hypothetical protein
MYDLAYLLALIILRSELIVSDLKVVNDDTDDQVINFSYTYTGLLGKLLNYKREKASFTKDEDSLAYITYPLSIKLLNKYIDYKQLEWGENNDCEWEVEQYVDQVIIPDLIQYAILQKVKDNKYGLTIKINNIKWYKELVLTNVEDNLYQALSTAKVIREGYRIVETAGSHINVITKSGSVRTTTSKDCDCKQFNIANRRKLPCQHIILTRAYEENRKLFVDESKGLYTII